MRARAWCGGATNGVLLGPRRRHRPRRRTRQRWRWWSGGAALVGGLLPGPGCRSLGHDPQRGCGRRRRLVSHLALVLQPRWGRVGPVRCHAVPQAGRRRQPSQKWPSAGGSTCRAWWRGYRQSRWTFQICPPLCLGDERRERHFPPHSIALPLPVDFVNIQGTATELETCSGPVEATPHQRSVNSFQPWREWRGGTRAREGPQIRIVGQVRKRRERNAGDAGWRQRQEQEEHA